MPCDPISLILLGLLGGAAAGAAASGSESSSDNDDDRCSGGHCGTNRMGGQSYCDKHDPGDYYSYD